MPKNLQFATRQKTSWRLLQWSYFVEYWHKSENPTRSSLRWPSRRCYALRQNADKKRIHRWLERAIFSLQEKIQTAIVRRSVPSSARTNACCLEKERTFPSNNSRENSQKPRGNQNFSRRNQWQTPQNFASYSGRTSPQNPENVSTWSFQDIIKRIQTKLRQISMEISNQALHKSSIIRDFESRDFR